MSVVKDAVALLARTLQSQSLRTPLQTDYFAYCRTGLANTITSWMHPSQTISENQSAPDGIRN
jgi:hypothetical protein